MTTIVFLDYAALVYGKNRLPGSLGFLRHLQKFGVIIKVFTPYREDWTRLTLEEAKLDLFISEIIFEDILCEKNFFQAQKEIIPVVLSGRTEIISSLKGAPAKVVLVGKHPNGKPALVVSNLMVAWALAKRFLKSEKRAP